ncbi:BURP domain-containing protein 9-like [Oryza glaberrima]|uniref:BURP domain-containing protein 9-like n=1 Tax=Oryza glaberrima TaxID=4538 RepID=UPI00224C53B0|nr:BURP domain-containing protein 9-like [Oryza glaberrima]
MERFYLYNKGHANEGDDQTMEKFYLYNKGHANEEDDQTMEKFYLYNKGQAKDGDDQKMEKIYLYNKDQANDWDDQKMEKFYLYHEGKANYKDDQNMEKFYLYKKGHANDEVDHRMDRFYLYNKDQANDWNDEKRGEFYLYNKDQTNDEDDHKIGEEHKYIHSHGHGHVHFPEGAKDLYFFEDNLAPGSVLITRILSARQSSIFLHRNNSKHIPFSMKNITDILTMFSPVSATMADGIAATLQACEHTGMVHGEKAKCVTSIESLLDVVVSSLGTKLVRALTPGAPMEGVPSLRYIGASATPVPNSQSMLACHDMLYPYKVFFCHTPKQTRLYQVSLVSGESGRPLIDGLLAVCHQNTSDWDTSHPFFHFMDVKPGETTACHFFGRGSIIWVPVPSVKEATQ